MTKRLNVPFFLLLTAISLPIRAESGRPEARIKIDTERAIGTVDPMLFGNFTEHLGRCIYGGIYDEGNPLSDADGFRRDVMDAVKRLNVSVLRWPGGNFVSGYNWTDGIGPKDKRPMRRDDAWGALESNRFGTDEFLKYCEKVGAQPYICINAGLGSVDDARHWVEYCNEPENTAYAQMRKANGHAAPYKVKIWGLGNEIDGPWQLGHKSAEDYAKFALEAAKAMRRADDSIQLIASGSSNFGPNADWIGWNRVVLDRLKDEINYISLHTYIGNRESNLEKFLGQGADVDRRIEIVKGQILAAEERQTVRHPIHIAFDEWNVWYETMVPGGEFAIGKTGLEERYRFEDALAMGMFLNSFFRHADVVKMANLAQLVNVIAPIYAGKDGVYLQTTYWPLLEYGKQRGAVALDLQASSPSYEYSGRKIGYLDTSATFDPSSGLLRINVLNRSRDRDIVARVDNATGELSPDAQVWRMNNADLKARNTFGSEKVRPIESTEKLEIVRNGFQFAFPKHTLTILTLKVKQP